MSGDKSAKSELVESVQRIEPARLEDIPEAISDVLADLSAGSARLERSLHPRTAASLADLVRIMNTYYSNLIEGHNTRPPEIERALAGEFEDDLERVERSEKLKPEASRLLEEALIRGEFERGDIPRITGLPERTARRVFNDVVAEGLLRSDTPKGAVSLRFPTDTLDIIFPRLFPQT